MNTGKTLFAQLMDFLPWTTFTRIVDRYGGDHRVRTLSCAEQYRSMAFAQLTYRESLRDIETCLSVHESPWAALSSERSCLRNSGETRVSGLTRRTSRQSSQRSRRPCNVITTRPWPDLEVAKSAHHPDTLGATVPMYRLRNGELGFPFDVSIAS